MELMCAKSMLMHCLRCQSSIASPLSLVRATAQVLMEPAHRRSCDLEARALGGSATGFGHSAFAPRRDDP
jgi:hypothetical protein